MPDKKMEEYKGYYIESGVEGINIDWSYAVRFSLPPGVLEKSPNGIWRSMFDSQEEAVQYAKDYIDCYIMEGMHVNGYNLKNHKDFVFLFRNGQFLGEFAIFDISFLEQGVAYRGLDIRGIGGFLVVIPQNTTEDDVYKHLPMNSGKVADNFIKGRTYEKALKNAKLYVDEILSENTYAGGYKVITYPHFILYHDGTDGITWKAEIYDKNENHVTLDYASLWKCKQDAISYAEQQIAPGELYRGYTIKILKQYSPKNIRCACIIKNNKVVKKLYSDEAESVLKDSHKWIDAHLSKQDS